mmetsp:Transcript_26983/g.68485  ORF Transcript_26983/g.68485 Transcript_26983/m.68485 type:complete len:472 (-) Transcript_26983:925-2340(-)
MCSLVHGFGSLFDGHIDSLVGCLVLPAAADQRRLGEPVGGLLAQEDHVARSLELDAIKVGGHGHVVGVVGVLLVDNGGHLVHGLHHLLLGGHPVRDPIRDVLRADAERRPVLHQLHVVYVGDLGAPHALPHPPDNVPEQPLDVVVELLLHLLRVELARQQGDGEDILDLGHGALSDLRLPCKHVAAVVVEGVEGRRRGRGGPRGVGPRHGVPDLLLEHLLHVVGGGPHALADLPLAGELDGDARVHVVVLVRLDPDLLLDLVLGKEGARLEARVDLVARAVEESGVDEGDAVLGLVHACSEVGGRAALLVHDPHLDRLVGEPEGLLGAAEELRGQGDLLGAVHLGLDKVHGAGAAVLEAWAVHQVVLGAKGSYKRVEKVLGDLLAVVRDGIGIDVEPNVAHQQDHTAGEGEGAPRGGGVDAVGVHAAHDGLAALVHRGREGAAHQAVPITVARDLVLGVDGGDRVFTVSDG